MTGRSASHAGDVRDRATAPVRLQLRGIRKVYPGVLANDGIDLAVRAGEIHAVLGENGAGKSTLMKIIYGVTRPTAGEVRWEGAVVHVDSPARARALGIGMVFQHFALFETLSVAENVALGLPGAPNLRELSSRIETVSRNYGLPVEPQRLVHVLSVGERQRVEIVRSLLQEPKLLIMDEPTSVLTPQAVRELFATLRQLAAEGRSILYISHKLDEIQALCDVATILRAGKVTGTCIPAQETPQSLARMMIGQDLPASQHGAPTQGGAIMLRLAGVARASEDPFGTDLQDIHLEVKVGEIVGIAGVSGNGQKELLEAISGEELQAEPRALQIGDIDAGRLGPAARRALGVSFVVVPNLSLAANALLTAHRRGMVRHGLIDGDEMQRFAAEVIERFEVRASGVAAPAKSVSGGNLQKFIVGREVLQQPRLLVVAQPTAGVDVGATASIRQTLIDLRNGGAAVLVVSEELEELFEICDRIAVLARGRLSPARPVVQTSVEELGVLMAGMSYRVHADARSAAGPTGQRDVA